MEESLKLEYNSVRPFSGIWFQKMTELHPRLQEVLQQGATPRNVLGWTTKGRAVFILVHTLVYNSLLRSPPNDKPQTYTQQKFLHIRNASYSFVARAVC